MQVVFQPFLCKSSIIFNEVSLRASRNLLVPALEAVRMHDSVMAVVHQTIEELQVLPSPYFGFTSDVQGFSLRLCYTLLKTFV